MEKNDNFKDREHIKFLISIVHARIKLYREGADFEYASVFSGAEVKQQSTEESIFNFT